MEELLKVAESRGYKPEWANHIYMSRIKKLEKLKGVNAPAHPPPPPIIQTDIITEFQDLEADFDNLETEFQDLDMNF